MVLWFFMKYFGLMINFFFYLKDEKLNNKLNSKKMRMNLN